MRAIIALCALWLLAACGDARGSGGSGGSLLSESGGEIALADGGSLEYGITSEQYKRWDRARKGIDRRVAARFGAILQPDAPTERSIDRAVAYLESEPSARRAIEAAGMSIRAFVIMTVALEQEMRRASGQPVVRQADTLSLPYEFPAVDTSMFPPAPVPTPVPAPVPVYPVDTFSRVPPAVPGVPPDTTARVTMPRVIVPPPARDTPVKPPPTIFRRDTTRPDTARPRPDPARPDTARPRPPPDTTAGVRAPPPHDTPTP